MSADPCLALRERFARAKDRLDEVRQIDGGDPVAKQAAESQALEEYFQALDALNECNLQQLLNQKRNHPPLDSAKRID